MSVKENPDRKKKVIYGISYQNVSPTSTSMATPLDFPSSSHTNPYVTPIHPLREKCPNTEFFLVRITPYLSVFSPNAGKYKPGKTSYWDTFHAVIIDLKVTTSKTAYNDTDRNDKP